MCHGLDAPAGPFVSGGALVHRMIGGHIFVLREDAPSIRRHQRGTHVQILAVDEGMLCVTVCNRRHPQFGC